MLGGNACKGPVNNAIDKLSANIVSRLGHLVLAFFVPIILIRCYIIMCCTMDLLCKRCIWFKCNISRNILRVPHAAPLTPKSPRITTVLSLWWVRIFSSPSYEVSPSIAQGMCHLGNSYRCMSVSPRLTLDASICLKRAFAWCQKDVLFCISVYPLTTFSSQTWKWLRTLRRNLRIIALPPLTPGSPTRTRPGTAGPTTWVRLHVKVKEVSCVFQTFLTKPNQN